MAVLGSTESRARFEAAAHYWGWAEEKIRKHTPARDLEHYLRGEFRADVPLKLTRRQPTATGQALGDELVSRLEVANALRRLPYRQRRVIELRFIDDVSCDQVSLRLSISERTVSEDTRLGLEQMAEWIYEWR